MYKKFIKRPMDFILSLAALTILSPVLIILALLVRLKLGKPILFKQNRPGLNEKIFTLYKFRTMTNDRDENGTLLPDELRLTKFGKILRSTSLDELPELINILKGDMAIIGPRPLLIKYLPLYNNHQKRRHKIRPGLSGLAQVNGRNAISWEDKFDLDVKYVDTISFFLDVRILCLSIVTVFKRDGISAMGSQTMPEFLGTEKIKYNRTIQRSINEKVAIDDNKGRLDMKKNE